MKKLSLFLAILASVASFFLATQAMAQVCGSGVRCDPDIKSCDPGNGRPKTGECVQYYKDGPGNIPSGCSCRLKKKDEALLPPVLLLPVLERMTLEEAYRARAGLDAVQDNLDEHIISLEAASGSESAIGN